MGTTQPPPEEAVRIYIEAWNVPDDAVRRHLLETCWTEDGIYVDPLGEVRGREALAAHIGRFLREGAYGRRSRVPDPNHQRGQPSPQHGPLYLGPP